MAELSYDDTIECQGVRIPFVPSIVTPKIERAMRRGRYEGGEGRFLAAELRPGDRVLELGAGVGLCSTIAARSPGVERVVAVEANPDLLPMIRETHRLNGADRVDLRGGVVTAGPSGPMTFFLRADFWASSMEPHSRPYERTVEVPAVDFGALMEDLRPTVVVCDIEGGELGLFTDPALDLSGVRLLLMELHPKVYGEEGMARIAGTLAARGFRRRPGPDSSVGLFEPATGPAAAAVAAPAPSRMPARSYRTWPVTDPRVLIATCMKDEGPYILEWLAWHRAIGVTDVVVFTNDCSDGTDRLLDRLEDLGEVTHLPNPALATDSSFFQPAALTWLHHLRAFREADFAISIDVDEFVNIHAGDGTLADLLAATGPFDALSMTELNHGANGRIRFEPGWITAQCPGHDTVAPGKWRSRRGVKTITRLSPRVERIRNHRPDFLQSEGPVLWLDGSGRWLAALQQDREANGIDCRGSYDLVTLEHYPLRSIEGFLMKMVRGDVVVAGKQASQRYWRQRNRDVERASVPNPRVLAAARAIFDRYLSDPETRALHEAACAFHAARSTEILARPEIAARRDWILAEAWGEEGRSDDAEARDRKADGQPRA